MRIVSIRPAMQNKNQPVYDGIGLVCMVMSVNARSWMISGCESIAVILPILGGSSKSLTVQSGIVHPLTSFATIGGGTQV